MYVERLDERPQDLSLPLRTRLVGISQVVEDLRVSEGQYLNLGVVYKKSSSIYLLQVQVSTDTYRGGGYIDVVWD